VSASSTKPQFEFPLVVQVGFAGTRRLPAGLEEQIQVQVAEQIEGLCKSLNLKPRHFLCGISQLAIGADTVFTRVCQSLQIPQRIFLPQHRDEFLNAVGTSGPDFDPSQKDAARTLFNSPHVIQERVVSDAADRRERFHDVNLEILRASDVIVCLVAAKSSGTAGGTQELIDLATKRRRPVLELSVEVVEGKPILTSKWHGQENFRMPVLPAAIDSGATEAADGTIPPNVSAYYGSLKKLASNSANKQRKFFKWAASVVIGAHVLATMLAVVALTQHSTQHSSLISWLLLVELLLLAAGFGMHQYIHRSHAVENWALSRLVAEVARSVTAIGDFHAYLEHLFSLPFPQQLRPLLRTVSMLHLQNSRSHAREPWEGRRTSYISSRLVDPEKKAQIPYHEGVASTAHCWLTVARRTFYAASVGAIFCTFTKLLIMCNWIPLEPHAAAQLAPVLGSFAVVLPVIAVAALSLAAAFDVEARYHTSKELLEFLQQQVGLLQNASSLHEYSRLMLETESRLLGETVNWYARRSFLGVA